MEPNKWTKSSRCAADSPQCVEVRHTDGNYVEARQSGKPEVVLTYSVDEWTTFIEGVKAGDFDV